MDTKSLANTRQGTFWLAALMRLGCAGVLRWMSGLMLWVEWEGGGFAEKQCFETHVVGVGTQSPLRIADSIKCFQKLL
jgi:hypothetical protein